MRPPRQSYAVFNIRLFPLFFLFFFSLEMSLLTSIFVPLSFSLMYGEYGVFPLWMVVFYFAQYTEGAAGLWPRG